MDESTEGVTLQAGFVVDVLREYEGMRKMCAPVFRLAEGLHDVPRDALVPMATYNEICDWIEANFGVASIRNAGRAIGGPVYEGLLEAGEIGDGSSPNRVLDGLKFAADTMIQDPKGRGWEIVERSDRSCRLRRTQTFNCMLQEGLLTMLVERTQSPSVVVSHVLCTRRGDEYCEYEVRWIRPLTRTGSTPSQPSAANPRDSRLKAV